MEKKHTGRPQVVLGILFVILGAWAISVVDVWVGIAMCLVGAVWLAIGANIWRTSRS
jgi:hypothetical protein